MFHLLSIYAGDVRQIVSVDNNASFLLLINALESYMKIIAESGSCSIEALVVDGHYIRLEDLAGEFTSKLRSPLYVYDGTHYDSIKVYQQENVKKVHITTECSPTKPTPELQAKINKALCPSATVANTQKVGSHV